MELKIDDHIGRAQILIAFLAYRPCRCTPWPVRHTGHWAYRSEHIQYWHVPTSWAEVEVFLWLTLFVRISIPGQTQHALIIKQLYLEDVNVELTGAIKKQSVRKKWVEKAEFTWGPDQQK